DRPLLVQRLRHALVKRKSVLLLAQRRVSYREAGEGCVGCIADLAAYHGSKRPRAFSEIRFAGPRAIRFRGADHINGVKFLIRFEQEMPTDGGAKQDHEDQDQSFSTTHGAWALVMQKSNHGFHG